MTQDELRTLVARTVADYVLVNVPEGTVLGVGIGSTANLFTDAIVPYKARFAGAVSNFEASIRCLQDHGFTVLDLNKVDVIPAYVDDADEIDVSGAVTKSGDGVLTCEEIVISVAKVFVCITDGNELVETMGAFPLLVEVVPMARAAVARQPAALGGQSRLRMTKEGQIYKADSGNMIIDVMGLHIADPKDLELMVNEIPGMVTVDLFAKHGANVLSPGTEVGMQRRDF